MASRAQDEAPEAQAITFATRPVGRPSQLTDAMREQLAKLIAAGQFAVDAAASVGIGQTTYYRWLELGRKARRGPYRKFWEAIERAQAERRVRLLAQIRKASREPRHWQANAWILQHTDAAMFAPRLRVLLEGELQGAIDRVSEAFAHEPETLERILVALAGSSGLGAPAGDPSEAGPGIARAGGLADPVEALEPAARVPGPRG